MDLVRAGPENSTLKSLENQVSVLKQKLQKQNQKCDKVYSEYTSNSQKLEEVKFELNQITQEKESLKLQVKLLTSKVKNIKLNLRVRENNLQRVLKNLLKTQDLCIDSRTMQTESSAHETSLFEENQLLTSKINYLNKQETWVLSAKKHLDFWNSLLHWKVVLLIVLGAVWLKL